MKNVMCMVSNQRIIRFPSHPPSGVARVSTERRTQTLTELQAHLSSDRMFANPDRALTHALSDDEKVCMPTGCMRPGALHTTSAYDSAYDGVQAVMSWVRQSLCWSSGRCVGQCGR